MNRLKKVISVLLCGVTIGCSMASCAKTTVSTEIISSLFTDLSKVSYSMDYTQLKDNKTNKENSWRQGMVSGNGMQGFITSGSPYEDTFIYQNMHFIMPNDNPRYCPVVSDELETVKQAIVKGEDIVDDASYDDVYSYHPGAQMRITMDKNGIDEYVRYTDYETGQVGVYYSDKSGEWNRKAFTSMADGVVITQIEKSSQDAKVNMTLSVDDISTLAKFGNKTETLSQYPRAILISSKADKSKEETIMAKSKLVKANEKIAEKVVNGYKKIEETVVGGYKKIEEGAVNGFTKISDSFVDEFLTKEGETVEEAKARLAAEQREREAGR